MVFVRNNTETRLARMRQAAADIAAVLEPEDIRADFPSAATWYETLTRMLADLDSREDYLDWTLVVLAGSCGAGKSSLLNFMTGENSAPVGNIRPTTTKIRGFSSGCPTPEFCDYLGLPEITTVPTVPGERGLPQNLVVVELPDRRLLAEDERLVSAVEGLLDAADLTIWVTDPQKYADADFLHDLRRWGDSGSSLMVLTHTDTLSESELEEVQADLGRIFKAQGLDLPLLATSCYQDASLAQFRQTVREAGAPPEAVYRGMQSRIRRVARVVSEEAQLDVDMHFPEKREDIKFCADISQACGLDTIETQFESDYLRDSRPVVLFAPQAWFAGVKTAAKKMLFKPHLAGAQEVQQAAAAYASVAGKYLPGIWRDFLGRRGTRLAEATVSALNLATASWDPPQVKHQIWWRMWWTLQWICNILAVIGFVWFLIWFVCLLGGVTLPGTIGTIPMGPLAFLGGALVTILCALGGIKISAARARRFGETGAAKFRQLTDEVSRKAFLEPMRQNLSLYTQLKEFGQQVGGI